MITEKKKRSRYISPEVKTLHLRFIRENKELTATSIAAKLNVSCAYIGNVAREYGIVLKGMNKEKRKPRELSLTNKKYFDLKEWSKQFNF